MNLSPDKLRSRWYEIEHSLWFLPAVLTVSALVLALATVRIDEFFRFDREHSPTWVFGGGSEGARGVLSAIAGTMMTVTALVFSITVVALQVASSQLTPRALRSVMADRGNQTVLGVFVATFTYALVVLRTVRSPVEDRGGFVPALSVSVAIALALASVGFLIFFMHHSANSLRASEVIARISGNTRSLIESLYPEEGQSGPPAPLSPSGSGHAVPATRSGYLQSIDTGALVALAERKQLTFAIQPAIGDFILPGAIVARAWPPSQIDDDIAAAIRDALNLGAERTMQADVEFGLQQLADIALRALSPGINDPTTAIACTNHLAALIVLLGNRGAPRTIWTSDDGALRLLVPAPAFPRLVDVAFEQIRHYGASNPVFTRRLADLLAESAALLPPTRGAALLRLAPRPGSDGEEDTLPA